MKTWILVAARDGVKIFQQEGPSGAMVAMAEFRNPDGKMKNQELVSDKPGRSMDRSFPNRHSLGQHTEPREHLLETFLKTVASAVDQGMEKKEFSDLVLVAESHVLGVLRDALSKRALEKVRASIVKNLLHLTDREIHEHIAAG